MAALQDVIRFITDSDFRFSFYASRGLNKHMSDEEYLKRLFKIRLGYPLNLDDPKTFNEKLNWIKLYDRRPEYTMMVDKYEVKPYIAKTIGKEYVIPTYGVWSQFDEIDFDSLPEQFVLKCTHDSGGLVICRSKSELDRNAAKKKIEKCLRKNYYNYAREWPYKDVQPRILAEKYMEDETSHDLKDYKFFAFDGVVKALFVASDRQIVDEETKFDFFDADYNHLDIRNGHPNSVELPDKPQNFDKMKHLAEVLSVNIPEVRVDFYDVNGRVYFGELTFSHFAGLRAFEPQEWDLTFGSWISLPIDNNK